MLRYAGRSPCSLATADKIAVQSARLGPPTELATQRALNDEIRNLH